MPKVVFCRALHPTAMAMLAARPEIEVKILTTEFRGPPLQKELAENIGDADAIMVGLEKVQADLLAIAPKLRVVSRFGVGFDTLDIPECTRRGVTVGVVNGANDLSVAEHAMMLMLAVARRTTEYDASVQAGTWMIQTGRRMHELSERTILIVGYGRIGTRVAKLCTAFGMKVMVHDPAFPTPRIAADGHTPAPHLMAAVPQADVISLHCPLSDETRKMVDASFLKQMKPTAWLINTARGGPGRRHHRGGRSGRAGPGTAEPRQSAVQAAQRRPGSAQRRSAAGMLRQDVAPRGAEHPRLFRWQAGPRLRREP